MPQEPAGKSGLCDFAPEIDRFLDFVVDRYEIDESRIYLTGISCGGIGVWDYAASAKGDRVAAAVPISGQPGYSMDRFGCGIASRTQDEQPQLELEGDVRNDHDSAPPAHRCEHDEHEEAAPLVIGRCRYQGWGELGDWSDYGSNSSSRGMQKGRREP